MDGDYLPRWSEANQAWLLAEVVALKTRLRTGAARPVGQGERARGALTPALPPALAQRPPALEAMARTFGLSSFERDLLLLCAAIEFDPEFAPLCAALSGGETGVGGAGMGGPSFGLALAVLDQPHWSALAPDGPLRRWRLVEPGAGTPLTAAPLRIDERVLHALLGLHPLDERLAPLLRPLVAEPALPLAASQLSLVERIVAAWAPADGAPVIRLCGEAAGCRALAAAVAEALGAKAALLAEALIPAGAAEQAALARLLEREARLGGFDLLLLEAEPAAEAASSPDRLALLLDRLEGQVMVSGWDGRAGGTRRLLTFDVRRPSAAEQRGAWHAALGLEARARGAASAAIEAVSGQFDLPLGAIRTIAAEALADAAASDGGGAEGAGAAAAAGLWSHCRRHQRARLDGLAQRIETSAGWEDLVLPPAQTALVRGLAAQLRHRATVHERWGFAAKSPRGLGLAALFWGPSGTGKTLAAEVAANALDLDLYRLDLSAVVSKYIGETEKNLRHVFDAAEASGAVLLLDEADALLGKRSEVKDSHDRYANIEVSYLLQRMEAYRGLAILTTNMKSALDPAFLRRLRCVVEFPFPDAAERARIWRRVFPAATPTAGLDAERLAQLRLAGGNIRNIALQAAFLAAEAGEPVGMAQVREAARMEYLKLERQMTAAETEGWP